MVEIEQVNYIAANSYYEQAGNDSKKGQFTFNDKKYSLTPACWMLGLAIFKISSDNNCFTSCGTVIKRKAVVCNSILWGLHSYPNIFLISDHYNSFGTAFPPKMEWKNEGLKAYQ